MSEWYWRSEISRVWFLSTTGAISWVLGKGKKHGSDRALGDAALSPVLMCRGQGGSGMSTACQHSGFRA